MSDPVLVERIENDFVPHAAPQVQMAEMKDVRQRLKSVAMFVEKTCPKGRELALALTHLEEAMFWANAAISRPHPRVAE